MELRNSFTIIGLLVCAVGSGILLLQSDQKENTANTITKLDTGYYMLRPRLTGTGVNGDIIYRISAETAEQSIEDGGITLKAVRMAYDPGTDIPWSLVADQGRVPPDGKVIELTGNVIATSEKPGQAPTIFFTEQLEVDPDLYIAKTEQKVTIENAGSRIYATGMQAWFREDRLQLASNVNGKYFP